MNQELKNKINQKVGVVKTELNGNQTVYDATNRKKGTIKKELNGNISLYDSMNRKLGTYDPRMNVTKDQRNMNIGKGNLLLQLLGFVDLK